MDTGALLERISVARSGRVTPMMFEHELLEQARSDRRRVVLPEGTEERVLRAADVLLRRDVCDLTLLGDPTSSARRPPTWASTSRRRSSSTRRPPSCARASPSGTPSCARTAG